MKSVIYYTDASVRYVMLYCVSNMCVTCTRICDDVKLIIPCPCVEVSAHNLTGSLGIFCIHPTHELIVHFPKNPSTFHRLLYMRIYINIPNPSNRLFYYNILRYKFNYSGVLDTSTFNDTMEMCLLILIVIQSKLMSFCFVTCNII